jgi:predicted RecB family nuclease
LAALKLGLETAPVIILDHLSEIEKRARQCHAQAVEQDSLSLLRGLREKELNRYRRKGLFT